MKYFIIFFLLTPKTWAVTSSVKFTAKTNGPGISVEGEVKEANIQTDFNNLEGATFSTDIMNLTTGMEKRDKHLHEKVFQVEKSGVGKIDYSLTQIHCPEVATDEVECDCMGKIKIKEVSKEIKFKILLNKKRQELEGKTSISLNQFNLTAPTFMGISVLDDVDIFFKVNAK